MDKRYENGKIYTIRCRYDDNLIYVGSTIEKYLSSRMSKHRYDNRNRNKLREYINDDWQNWYIELYENYPCNSKHELYKREGEIIRLIGNINKRIEGRTLKEYYLDNKEYNAEKKKEWRENNKEKYDKYHKEYRENNKEIIKEKDKIHYQNNKEKIIKQKKKHYENNKETIKEKRKEKITCDCGGVVRKSDMSRHRKTIKHQEWQKKNML